MRIKYVLVLLLVFGIGFVLGRISVDEPVREVQQTTRQAETAPVEEAEADEDRTMWIANTVVNIRAHPGLDAEIAGRLFQGDSIRVTGQDGEWSAITMDEDSTGWVFTPLLSDTRVDPLPAVQTGSTRYSVTEKNPLWWRYSYQVDLTVYRSTSQQWKVTVRFVNDEGFELDTDIVYTPMFDRAQQYTIRENTLVDMPLAERIAGMVVDVQAM